MKKFIELSFDKLPSNKLSKADIGWSAILIEVAEFR